MIKNNFPENLKSCRQALGLSHIELAKRLNIDQSTISLWENGLRSPTLDYLIKIANFFEISLDDLVDN